MMTDPRSPWCTCDNITRVFINDDRPSLAMMHMWQHNARIHHGALLNLWCTLMAYFVISPNGEESLNKWLSPHPDHLRGGPSHGKYTSCVKHQVYETGQTYRQTDPITIALHSGSKCNKPLSLLYFQPTANGKLILTIIELTMWPCVCVCVCVRVWKPNPITADVTVTKIAGYVRIRILMNQWFFSYFWHS